MSGAFRLAAIWPATDGPACKNYSPNYCLWDALGRLPEVELERIKLNSVVRLRHRLLAADLILLPMWRRLLSVKDGAASRRAELDVVTGLGRPTVMFDNDSHKLPMGHPVYDGVDFIFYRCDSKDGRRPEKEGAWLPWCVDLDRFRPSYGGRGVVMVGGQNRRTHSSRHRLFRYYGRWHNRRGDPRIRFLEVAGEEYVATLQRALAAVSNCGDWPPMPRAKLLEIAACGTAVITDWHPQLELYFPRELLYVFRGIRGRKSLGHAINWVLRNREEAVRRQHALRAICEARHGADRQARLVLPALRRIAAGTVPDRAVLERIQRPLDGPE